VRALKRGEGRSCADALVAQQEKDADRLGLADDQNEVELEHRKLRHLQRGALAEDDVDVIGLGLASMESCFLC
jgi:Asp/Glu/hydantoin racemase